MPLRDRVFTKDDITRLRKKKWIEVKDLIFETDRNVLDGIRYDMIRWRKAENLQLGKYQAARSIGAVNRNSRRAAMRSSTMMVPTSPAMQT